jgi:hypothetical protein
MKDDYELATHCMRARPDGCICDIKQWISAMFKNHLSIDKYNLKDDCTRSSQVSPV